MPDACHCYYLFSSVIFVVYPYQYQDPYYAYFCKNFHQGKYTHFSDVPTHHPPTLLQYEGGTIFKLEVKVIVSLILGCVKFSLSGLVMPVIACLSVARCRFRSWHVVAPVVSFLSVLFY
jgi:hypothetical protein